MSEAKEHNGHGQKDEWKEGEKACFEYHCEESHDSGDAELWYRSRQEVTVLGLDTSGEKAVADCLIERAEAGMPLTYLVRFSDGFEGAVYEDELLVNESFCNDDFTPGVRPR